MPKALSSPPGSVDGPLRQSRRQRLIPFGRTVLGVDLVPRPRGPVERWVLPAALLVIGTALALFRIPPEHWDILWAEDGAIFLTGAYAGDPLVLFQPYAGYMHLFPRIATAIAATVAPVDAVSTVQFLSAAVLTATAATSVYLFARQRMSSRLIPLALWLQIAILPVAGGEVADSVANSHWYLVFAAIWAAIITPRGVSLRVVQCVVVATAAMSDPLALVLLAPLVLLRILTLPRGRHQVVTIVYLSSALVQGVMTVYGTIVLHTRSLSGGIPPFYEFIEQFSARVGFSSLVGVQATETIGTATGTVIPVLVTAILIAFLIFTAVRDPSRRWLLLAMAVIALALALLCFTMIWGAIADVGPFDLDRGGRYAVVPTLALFSALCIALDSWVSRIPGRRGLIPGAVLVALVAIVGANDYRVWDLRAEALDWPVSLEQARDQCDLQNPPTTVGALLIAPNYYNGTVIPCEILDR